MQSLVNENAENEKRKEKGEHKISRLLDVFRSSTFEFCKFVQNFGGTFQFLATLF